MILKYMQIIKKPIIQKQILTYKYILFKYYKINQNYYFDQ